MKEHFFLRYIRNKFIAGLVTFVPFVITFWVLKGVFNFVDGLLGPEVSRFIGRQIPGVGIVATIVLVFILGMLTTNFIGRSLLHLGERIIAKIPFIKTLYDSVKQLITAIAVSKRKEFQNVVLIEYPRRGAYVIGFSTKECTGELQQETEQTVVSIFVPSTPNPTTGMLVFVPKEDVIKLAMSVEEAMKVIISGGIVIPPTQLRRNPNYLPDEKS